MNEGFILIIVIAIIGFIVQFKLKSVFTKYSEVRFPKGMTGKEVAEKMLLDNGIFDVKVVSTSGMLTDHYNPQTKTINLSEGVFGSCSVAAAAVAAHECGHAVQHARAYGPLKMRSALVPIVSFSSMWAQIVLIIGIFTISSFPPLFWIGIAMFSMVLIFSVITLPVEYDASRRALVWLRDSHIVEGDNFKQAKEALTWAARTYLVAALSALATLVYYLGFANNRN